MEAQEQISYEPKLANDQFTKSATGLLMGFCGHFGQKQLDVAVVWTTEFLVIGVEEINQESFSLICEDICIRFLLSCLSSADYGIPCWGHWRHLFAPLLIFPGSRRESEYAVTLCFLPGVILHYLGLWSSEYNQPKRTYDARLTCCKLLCNYIVNLSWTHCISWLWLNAHALRTICYNDQ